MGLYDWDYPSRIILKNCWKCFGSTIEWSGLERIIYYRGAYELQGVRLFVALCSLQIGRVDCTQRGITSWYIESTCIHNVRCHSFNNYFPHNPHNELFVHSSYS